MQELQITALPWEQLIGCQCVTQLFQMLLVMPSLKIGINHKQSLAKTSINKLWIFYYLIVKRYWIYIHLLSWEWIANLSKLFMYLKRAPASSGHTLLWCGMSCGHGGPGGCSSSFSSLNFHWEIAVAKF